MNEEPRRVLQEIDEVLQSMIPTQEQVAYDTGKIVGFFPISKTRRMLRLAARLEKP